MHTTGFFSSPNLQEVEERLREADGVGGDGDGVGEEEHQSDGAAEGGAQGARDHVVDAAGRDLRDGDSTDIKKSPQKRPQADFWKGHVCINCFKVYTASLKNGQKCKMSVELSASLAVCGDGGHGDGGEGGDHVGQGYDEEALYDAGLAHHPSQSEEQVQDA